MKRIFTIMLFVGLAELLFCQSSEKPYWIKNLPQPKSSNSNFYYRVTFAEERTYDKAYAKAFARAILESSWKLGVDVNMKDDVKTLENNIMENVNVAPTHMNLPMNKVCEYVELDKNTYKTKVYILWQVAKYGNVQPVFEDFNKCK